ncbi:hypothetical protein ACE3MZ_05675 [Paenibacillus sp. WLX1005]|uniref:hypothetical protein n=1 Tax=Paenibacillus sp. WLX1005 TaxID=3243766 RepID=UPI0039843BA5
MKSELPAAAMMVKRFRSTTYSHRAWLFDSTIAALFVSLLGALYLSFALQQTVLALPDRLQEHLLLFLFFFIPLLVYTLVILAPLNRGLRTLVRQVPLQFLLFNIVALPFTWLIIQILPLPAVVDSPMMLWFIPVFALISYLYAGLFLSQASVGHDETEAQ